MPAFWVGSSFSGHVYFRKNEKTIENHEKRQIFYAPGYLGQQEADLLLRQQYMSKPSFPPPTSTFEGRLQRESRINVTTGKSWIPDIVRNDKAGIFGLFTSSSKYQLRRDDMIIWHGS